MPLGRRGKGAVAGAGTFGGMGKVRQKLSYSSAIKKSVYEEEGIGAFSPRRDAIEGLSEEVPRMLSEVVNPEQSERAGAFGDMGRVTKKLSYSKKSFPEQYPEEGIGAFSPKRDTIEGLAEEVPQVLSEGVNPEQSKGAGVVDASKLEGIKKLMQELRMFCSETRRIM